MIQAKLPQIEDGLFVKAIEAFMRQQANNGLPQQMPNVSVVMPVCILFWRISTVTS